ncbi:hypothetical protein WS71_09115 [Burkholderia mayonis]|uniref:Uncharacterized protein n=1 Tax=Burkholderia mayonis TaxID=1385591 RepID=A0A1B4FV24_9BURK|nr:hypothetical protein WS71_09115 [Burkholderia mayonis]KVE54456.1 hypothetical protein WS71_05300 [Burkholderia mayonis]
MMSRRCGGSRNAAVLVALPGRGRWPKARSMDRLAAMASSVGVVEAGSFSRVARYAPRNRSR